MKAATPLAEGLPRRRFSVADVMRMAEVGLIGHNERLEVLDGEIVVMFPKGPGHEQIKCDLNMHWGRYCPNDYVIVCATGLYASEMTYLQPDFMIFRQNVRYAELMGADVLLVVEVADFSLDYDIGCKPAIYAMHDVQEYWVIDAIERAVHIHRGAAGDRYASVETRLSSDRLVPAFAPAAFAIVIDDLLEH